MTNKITRFAFVLVLTALISCRDNKNDFHARVDAVLQRASDQYEYMMKNLPEDSFPKTYNAGKDKLETSGSGWWCSGFYPGTLLYLHEDLGNEKLKGEADRIMEVLAREQFNTTTHDLGFMMFCSFGNAERLNPSPLYEEILMNSAKSLASRFNETVGCIRSWDSRNDDYLVIIDNMMNLELLFWASEHSGDPFYYDIAVTHADTTLKNHFRKDNSSYHVLNYDVNTGAVKEKRTAQGAADESAWARGQAWGLYGYTVMYRATGEQQYLDQAVRIAEFILNHPNLPEDKVPYWDFNAPGIPNALRDSSAGAIMASALLELSGYTTGENAEKYFENAGTMLKTLTTDEYIAAAGTNGGFLLKHGVGHIPENSEVDVPLTYGDYYLIEALLRYKNMDRN
ncbi:glycoside hydrolase family 88 protein [Sinomicrobium weinanense]|uniref:Glycoside hydrolase family 88 protein n=1 Tax=Sinomicrobium weinanense TaxID=2842200 RepID=A0A926Q256_9FLAO|nr:glycoside hydrolase family 88 protein [Sinomicrobium weinanense]MBC9796163.1 glycoside hydrolase family 88 protein [Sinomicrobium weinanense]MBU3121914.1 glycoside hydrolase family 88 protein [Sinomicrobium weinanense]